MELRTNCRSEAISLLLLALLDLWLGEYGGEAWVCLSITFFCMQSGDTAFPGEKVVADRRMDTALFKSVTTSFTGPAFYYYYHCTHF